jgi:hypothetical protein
MAVDASAHSTTESDPNLLSKSDSICVEAPSDTDDTTTKYHSVWLSLEPDDGYLTAAQVHGVLKKSGLPENVLRQVWSRAKRPTPPLNKMCEAEFASACASVVEAGGALPDAAPTPVPAPTPTAALPASTSGEESATQHERIWASANPQGGYLTARQVQQVLKDSKLSESVLREIWMSCKKPVPPLDKMTQSEFTRACELVEKAGGMLQTVVQPRHPPGAAAVQEGGSNVDATAATTKYHSVWLSLEPDDGYLTAAQVHGVLKKSGLSENVLRQVWSRAKRPTPPLNKMCEAEFASACASVVEAGGALPDAAPTPTSADMPGLSLTAKANDAESGPLSTLTQAVTPLATVPNMATPTVADHVAHDADDYMATWFAAGPLDDRTILEGTALLALEPSNLPTEMLKLILIAAKNDHSKGEVVVGQEEFLRACQLVKEAGGLHLQNPDSTGVLDAIWHAATPLNGHITSAAVTVALQQTRLEDSVIRMIFRRAKIVGQPPFDQMNKAEWMKVCQLAVSEGGAPLTVDIAHRWEELAVVTEDHSGSDEDEDDDDDTDNDSAYNDGESAAPSHFQPINNPTILHPTSSSPGMPYSTYSPPDNRRCRLDSDDSDGVVDHEDDPLEAEEHENARERLRLQRRASSGPVYVAPVTTTEAPTVRRASSATTIREF